MVLTMAKGGVIEDTIAELISLSLATYYVPKMVALLTLRSFSSQDLSTRRDEEEEKKERYYQAFRPVPSNDEWIDHDETLSVSQKNS